MPGKGGEEEGLASIDEVGGIGGSTYVVNTPCCLAKWIQIGSLSYPTQGRDRGRKPD